MKSESYIVICKKCLGKSRLGIVGGQTVIYTDHTPIIAARLRPDMKWGFQCMCGQDSRVSNSESDQVDVLVQGGAHAIDAIKDSLKIKDEDKFILERQ